MFTWHPLVIRQRIHHIKERINDLDTQIELAQMQEEIADEKKNKLLVSERGLHTNIIQNGFSGIKSSIHCNPDDTIL